MVKPKSSKKEAYVQERLSFADDDSLAKQLLERVREWRGKTIIMAGHYMLAYRESEGRLVEVLGSPGEGVSAYEEDILRSRVGNYPEASFLLAAQVVSAYPQATIALLVNDHDFSRRQELPFGNDELARLRREYFRSHSSMPLPFSEIMAKFGIEESRVERNDADRESTATLPSHSFFFSETSLRNRFQTNTRKKLAGLPGMKVTGGAYRPRQLVWSNEDHLQEVCLVDDAAGCACSGAMIQFLEIFHQKQAPNVILFIPHECCEPVRASIEGSLYSGFLRFSNVIAVWGEVPDSSSKVPFQHAEVFQSRA